MIHRKLGGEKGQTDPLDGRTQVEDELRREHAVSSRASQTEALSSQMREPFSQHFISMTQNDLLSIEIHFRLLHSLAFISLRIPWDIIRERTRAGLQAARARGRKGGRPNVRITIN